MIISGQHLIERLAMVSPVHPGTLDVVREAMNNGKIVVSPFPHTSKMLSSFSLTLEIGKIYEPQIPSTVSEICVDFSKPDTLEIADKGFRLYEKEKFYLHPGVHNFARVETKHFLGVPNDLLGQITLKKEFTAYGLTIIGGITYIQPGFMGRATLDIKNDGNRPIALSIGLPVFEMTFETLSSSL